MTNSIEGAMPPLPDFPYDALWEPVRALGWTTRGQTDEVIDALRPLIEDYAKAYAAPLIARVAELQADAARYRWLRDNADVVFNETQHFPMRSGAWIYSQHPTRHELDAAIDAAIAARKEQQP